MTMYILNRINCKCI